MIYKIKIRDRKTGEEYFIVMGDSYKPFRDHFTDVVSYFTEKWHYASEDKHAECFGRTLTKEFLEVWSSKARFVSFGGLKMCAEEDYNEKVKEHNKKGNYEKCRFLEDIHFVIEHPSFLKTLLKEKRVVSEEELKKFPEHRKDAEVKECQ